MNSNKARASLNEIPEDASVRKPPLKKKKRGDKRTLTLENDEWLGITSSCQFRLNSYCPFHKIYFTIPRHYFGKGVGLSYAAAIT